MPDFKTKVLPHLVAIVVFALVSMFFFAPQYQGKVLRQDDMVRASGMGQDIKEHIEKYGEHPQWSGRMFGGMPAYLIDMNYDGRWVKTVADQAYFIGTPAAWTFIAMAGFYLMLLMFGVNPWLGIIGGITYGLSSYFIIIIGAGHLTKMIALAWIAPMVGSIWYAYRRRMWLGAALAGLFASIEISASHPQIPYYFLFVVLALVINEFVSAYKEKALARFGKVSALLALAGALAIGSNAVQLYYVASYTPESTRGKSELTDLTVNTENHTSGLDKDYATEWSYGKLETFNLLVPNLYGGGRDFSSDGEVAAELKNYKVPKDYVNSIPSYWGSQAFTEGPVYLGAVMIFLCVLGLFTLKGRDKWWIVAVSLLAIALAWGRNMMWLSSLFLDYFPMYNKFRTVSMILVIVEWSVPLLGILALQRFWKRDDLTDQQAMRGWKWSLIGVGGLCLFIGLVGPMLSSFSSSGDQEMGLPDELLLAMQNERATLMRADAFRSLGLVLAAAALIWLFLKEKIRGGWLVAGVGVLVLLDLFTVDKRYISEENFHPKRTARAIEMTDADRLILQDTTDGRAWRVANLTLGGYTFADPTNGTAYFHRTIGGYHAAKLRRYQDLIEHHLGKQNMAVYDMLNVKYFILPAEGEQGGADRVAQNPNACGSAWLVDTVRLVASPDQEISALDGLDPHTTAVVDSAMFPRPVNGLVLTADSTATIRLTDYRVNRLTYQTQASSEQLAVFSEVYYPKGWSVTIDGRPAGYFRANYVLRAMRIPAGEHTVVFSFAAPHYPALLWTTRLCSLALLLSVIAIAIIPIIACKSRKDHEQA